MFWLEARATVCECACSMGSVYSVSGDRSCMAYDDGAPGYRVWCRRYCIRRFRLALSGGEPLRVGVYTLSDAADYWTVCATLGLLWKFATLAAESASFYCGQDQHEHELPG